jgi:hypothetical protein
VAPSLTGAGIVDQSGASTVLFIPDLSLRSILGHRHRLRALLKGQGWHNFLNSAASEVLACSWSPPLGREAYRSLIGRPPLHHARRRIVDSGTTASPPGTRVPWGGNPEAPLIVLRDRTAEANILKQEIAHNREPMSRVSPLVPPRLSPPPPRSRRPVLRLSRPLSRLRRPQSWRNRLLPRTLPSPSRIPSLKC